ncbi:MAG: hypothetical protein ACR2NR_16275 [Solirubrobacteraceae bacterium]
MSAADTELAQRIAQQGREVVVERLRAAFAHQAATRPGDIDLARLEAMVQDASRRAGGALWRRSLAEAAMRELDIELGEALAHPAVLRAHALVGAPELTGASAIAPAPELAERAGPPLEQPAEPEPEREPELESKPELGRAPEPAPPALDGSQALRLGAVHVTGIETLRPGDRDIELRLSDAGLDVLKRSTGVAIGRLEWAEIEMIELPTPRRGLRVRGRARELHISTGRGQAQFELPGLTEDELHEHVEPTLERLRALGAGPRPLADPEGT